MRSNYQSNIIWLLFLAYCFAMATLLSIVQSEEPPSVSMAQLKDKFDKTEKLIRIQNKATGKFLTYAPNSLLEVSSTSSTSGEFVDVKLLDHNRLRSRSQVWILRETLGFPYTKNDSFTRLYSLRPSEMESASGAEQRIRGEFANSLWKIDFFGEDSGRPFYRLRNTFSLDCLTFVDPDTTDGYLRTRNAAGDTVKLKACSEDGAPGTEDYSLFYLRFWYRSENQREGPDDLQNL